MKQNWPCRDPCLGCLEPGHCFFFPAVRPEQKHWLSRVPSLPTTDPGFARITSASSCNKLTSLPLAPTLPCTHTHTLSALFLWRTPTTTPPSDQGPVLGHFLLNRNPAARPVRAGGAWRGWSLADTRGNSLLAHLQPGLFNQVQREGNPTK